MKLPSTVEGAVRVNRAVLSDIKMGLQPACLAARARERALFPAIQIGGPSIPWGDGTHTTRLDADGVPWYSWLWA
jgi:hypothetical protein